MRVLDECRPTGRRGTVGGYGIHRRRRRARGRGGRHGRVHQGVSCAKAQHRILCRGPGGGDAGVGVQPRGQAQAHRGRGGAADRRRVQGAVLLVRAGVLAAAAVTREATKSVCLLHWHAYIVVSDLSVLVIRL